MNVALEHSTPGRQRDGEPVLEPTDPGLAERQGVCFSLLGVPGMKSSFSDLYSLTQRKGYEFN